MSPFVERLQQQRAGVGIFIVLVLLPVAAYLFWTPPPAPALDPRTLCRLDAPAAHRIVLIDATDPLDATQKDAVLALIRRVAGEVGTYEKLSIAVVDAASPREPKVLFSACAPQSGSDRPDQNPLFLKAAWLRQFYNPALAAAARALDVPGEDQTPLIESIYGITRRADFGPDVPHRRLVIVSDMLQNTRTLYDQYRDGMTFANFRRRPMAYQNIPDLTGVAVTGFYIDRPDKQCVQGEAQRRFWDDYFQETGTAIRYLNWPWRASSADVTARCGGSGPPVTHRRRRHHRH